MVSNNYSQVSNDAKTTCQWHEQRIPFKHVLCQSCKNQGDVKTRTGRKKNPNHEVVQKPAEIERNCDFSKVDKLTLFIKIILLPSS
jgi:hypothetical protein